MVKPCERVRVAHPPQCNAPAPRAARRPLPIGGEVKDRLNTLFPRIWFPTFAGMTLRMG
jgi:hypothetical protein